MVSQSARMEVDSSSINECKRLKALMTYLLLLSAEFPRLVHKINFFIKNLNNEASTENFLIGSI